MSPCGRRWQQFAGVAPPGKDRRPPPRAGGPVTPLTSRRESRAADANLFASESCSLSLEPLGQIWMPKRTPRRRRVWACGVSRWTPSLGDLIIPFIYHFKSYTTYSNCTTIYCTILLFEYALITIRETASFSKGCSRVCLLGLHAATSP